MYQFTNKEIQSHRGFYRSRLRRTVGALLISLGVNFLFLGGIFYELLSQKIPAYYATNTAGYINKLSPRLSPNAGNEYLLKPFPPAENQEKTLTLSRRESSHYG